MSIINGATLNASKTKEVKTLKQEILSQSSGVKYVQIGFFTEVFAVWSSSPHFFFFLIFFPDLIKNRNADGANVLLLVSECFGLDVS